MFIVFDLDDTLADNAHRHHILADKKDHEIDEETWSTFFDACNHDVPVPQIIAICTSLIFGGHKIEIWTGRTEAVRAKTDAWLQSNLPYFLKINALRMRAVDDFRSDTEVKGQWVKEHGKPDLVFDDRNKVVDWWRSIGVVCCQVKESDY